MFEHTTEAEARKQILDLVADYCDTFHKKKECKEGDRIPYASRVYDHSEMVNLVDSSLEFWLTSGRYTDEFEKKLAEYLGVRYCSLAVSYTHLDVYKRQLLYRRRCKDPSPVYEPAVRKRRSPDRCFLLLPPPSGTWYWCI